MNYCRLRSEWRRDRVMLDTDFATTKMRLWEKARTKVWPISRQSVSSF